MSSYKKVSVIGLMATTILAAPAAFAADDIWAAIKEGKPILEMRYRYENVEQTGLANKANASTLRTRLGYETASFMHFKALVEFENVADIASGQYSNGITTTPGYPVVSDPTMTEVNRAQLTFDGLPDTLVTGGRQRINLDNQRFIGAVGWRQNEQTFDAVRITNKSLPKTELNAVYIGNINRVVGNDGGDYSGPTFLFNAAYSGLPLVKLIGYAYFVDIHQAPAASTRNLGLRAEGKYAAKPFTFTLNGEYANQKDYKNNPNSVNLNYYLIEGGVAAQGLSGLAGYEVMEGNGTVGFSTPLATLHKFQGWADAFLTTPKNGIRDLYFQAGYKPAVKVEPLSGLDFQVAYHKFTSGVVGGKFGGEWDFQVTKSFLEHYAVGLKYADFSKGQAPLSPASRKKFWLSLEVKY
jgi:hypothetical protein